MVVAAIGSIHLTLMAAVGIWLWSSPAQFELSQPNSGQQGSVDLPYHCTSITLLGGSIHMTSPGLRDWSLLIYSVFLTPVFNLFLPALVFLALYIGLHRWYPSTERGRRQAGVHSVVVGLSVLLVINAVFLVDTELTIAQVRDQQPVESAWTFGQTLALLLLALPVRDTALLESYRRDSNRRREIELRHNTAQLRSALERNDFDAIQAIMRMQHVDVNVVGEKSEAPRNCINRER
jgi:fumarate reductase subunit D